MNFKLFNIGQRQVLVERASDNEDGEQVVQMTYIENSKVIIKAGFNDTKHSEDYNTKLADKWFSEYGEKEAVNFLKMVDENLS